MLIFDRNYAVSCVLQSDAFSQLIRLTILRQQVIGPPYDKLADERSQLFQLGITLLLFFVSRIRISSSKNLGFKVLFEITARAEIFGIGKIEKSKVFREVVLNGCTGEDNASLNVERCKGLESKRVCRY